MTELSAGAGARWYICSQGRPVREFVVHRGVTASLLALGLIVADIPDARAQQPAPAAQLEGPSSPGTVQIATEKPRRQRRPLLDPAKRELRSARGILAGGIIFTTACGVGFGVWTYALAERFGRLQGASGDRMLGAGLALLACTVVSVAAIGLGGSRLRALRGSGRVAWTGGLGLRF